MVQPSVVRAVGASRAIVLQHIYYRVMGPDATVRDDGERWVPVLEKDIAEETGLSTDAVYRAVRELEHKGVLCSCQPDGSHSRRKWYRVDVVALDRATPAPESSRDSAGGPAKSSRASAGGSTKSSRGIAASIPIDDLKDLDLPPASPSAPREPSPSTAAVSKPASKRRDRPFETDARRLVDALWDRCAAEGVPRPVVRGNGNPYLAAVSVVQPFLAAGNDETQVARALWSAHREAAITTGAVQYRLNDARRNGQNGQNGRSSNFEATKAVMERMRNGEC